MTDRRHPHRVVFNLFVALLVTVLVAAALLLGLTVARFRGESQSRSRIEDFHLRSLAITLEVSARIGEAVEIVSEGDDGVDDVVEVGRDLPNVVFAIGSGIDHATELLADVDAPEFDATTTRARRQAAALSLGAAEGAWTRDEWKARLTAIDLTMFQLGRLHAITAETTVQDISRRADQVRNVSLVAVPVILVVGTTLVIRLFALVRRRLRQLDDATAQLLESQARIEQTRKIDALGTLAGGVAHDFNNLLTVMLGYAEVAEQQVGPESPARRPLSNIRSAGEQASNLTRQLLAFGQQGDVAREGADLNALVRGAETVVRGLVPDNVDLHLELGADVGTVVVHASQIEQIIVNLVVNARDAMPYGGTLAIVTSDVHVDADDVAIPAGRWCRLRVEDTGMGMRDDVRQQAFDPFFTTKPKGRGTGLGLSTVHGIVAACNGHVTVSSEVGRGTTFDVYLPVADVDVVAEQDEGRREVQPARWETVLLVEDETQIRCLLADVLDGLGYDVIAAGTADEALDICRSLDRVVHLVLTDVVMPGMQGPELVRQLRRRHPEIAVVFMSGYADSPVVDAVHASGETFLTKPFELQTVIDAISATLDRAAAAPR